MSQLDKVPCPTCGGPREILMETRYVQHIYCPECKTALARTHDLVTPKMKKDEEAGQ